MGSWGEPWGTLFGGYREGLGGRKVGFYSVFGMILGGRPFLGGSGRGVLGG